MARRWRKNNDTCSGDRRMARTIAQIASITKHKSCNGERGDDHRRFDAITHPGDGDLTRTVSNPGKSPGNDQNRNQKQDDPDHPGLIACRARALYRRQIGGRPLLPPAVTALWRSSRARAHASSHRASPGRLEAPSISACAVSTSIRASTAEVSSPTGAPSGRIRTSLLALACSRSRKSPPGACAPDALSQSWNRHAQFLRRELPRWVRRSPQKEQAAPNAFHPHREPLLPRVPR